MCVIPVLYNLAPFIKVSHCVESCTFPVVTDICIGNSESVQHTM